MSIADLSIKRPIFISCIAILLFALGFLAFKKMPVDLFPDVTFPVVMVNTPYPGAGPTEVETLISKVLEDELSNLPGIKSLKSVSREGLSTVIAEFNLETDVKYAEQQIRDRVSSAKSKLPNDIKEPVIRRLDPADQPIMVVSIKADLNEAQLFELADDTIRRKLEQVSQVGLVEVLGGRKREILVELDRTKLKSFELSATRVSNSLAIAGMNVPAGKIERGSTETVIRTLGEFKAVSDIGKTVVNFAGNDVSVRINDIAVVKDTLEDEKNKTYFKGDKAILLNIYRQSGSNTIAVVNAVNKQVDKLNKELQAQPGAPVIKVVRDSSKMIKANVEDVKESILIGILLTVVVVYFFLGNLRSTIITSLALPNSLIGAFFLMATAHFSINVMSLLALSLSVGLLIDDAIVVRENIFRYMEHGEDPKTAASKGTKEVMLAVVATSLTVVAVFGPIAFLSGVVGQFFKQFGLTICFAMAISLFDALTIAPMLSAYLGGQPKPTTSGFFYNTIGVLVRGFGRFQDWLEIKYEGILKFSIRRPFVIILLSISIFVLSIVAAGKVPKTFLPAQDFGEFMVSLELPPGTSLEAMDNLSKTIDQQIRAKKEVVETVMTVGNTQGEANVANIYVTLVGSKQRSMNTSEFKAILRNELKPYAYANPIVKDIDMVNAGMRPFNVNIIGPDLDKLQVYSKQLFDKLKNHPGLTDVELSYKPGKPEFQVDVEGAHAEKLGISSVALGMELRTQTEGSLPAVYRENGKEYDIRVRVREDQRDLRQVFNTTYVPNINNAMVRLSDVARPIQTTGPANITRQDRGRYIQIAADVAPKGPGIGGVMKDIDAIFKKDIKLDPGYRYVFVGQAENFQELGQSMLVAAGLGILFIYLVLASLYESFITPFTIMLVLPLAACGAFIALFVTQHSLDLFSMIGCIMLLGISTKNSILLVDYTNQLIERGKSQVDAIIEAGKVRLRPILMTTVALIAGMIPIAIGLNEASRQRTSMGIAIIGGLISSTLLTLVVIPATYRYVERLRGFLSRLMVSIFVAK